MLPRCLVFSGLMLVLFRPSPDLLQVGRNLRVDGNQPVHNVSCILCSVEVSGKVSGHVRAFAGNVLLNGTVDGGILVFGGNVDLAAGSVVATNVIIIGGHLLQHPASRCSGHIVIPPLIFLPVILLICVIVGALIRWTRRSIRGPIVFPPLPRL